MTLPFLDSFDLLKHQIKHSATEFISELKILKRYQKNIENIFADSELTSSRRYRTITKSGNLAISGQNLNDIWSLSGIAHELGHCLYENNAKNSFLKPFYSELIAHIFEEQIVSLILRDEPSILKEWNHYQFSVDLLNLYFFILEWHPGFFEQQQRKVRFDPAALLFRESLFLIPGYQLVYGFASVWRCLLRKQNISIVDLLEYLINATNSNYQK